MNWSKKVITSCKRPFSTLGNVDSRLIRQIEKRRKRVKKS